ncbi:MAG: FHA domain-containing protein [Anaerolineae bacterium]|nr:FHA domain-containing protein [Thermoflexales bacterium]MDW8406611.1 FHA domain-containing protein [Anaerolineae bacterium]
MPNVLILFIAMLVASAGIAAWLTWRDVQRRKPTDPSSVQLAAAAKLNQPGQTGSAQSAEPLASPAPTIRTAVETVPAPLAVPAPPTDKQIASKTKEFQLICVSGALAGTAFSVGAECLISRGPVCWIAIPEPTLSAPHLAIDSSDRPIRIKDLNSRAGARIGQHRLEDARGFVELPADRSIQIGALTLAIEGGTLTVSSAQAGRSLAGKSYVMPAAFVVISRREMPVVITGDIDHRISDAHALMYVDNGALMIKDLNSTNGTRVNGKKLARQPMPLQAGDLIEIGQSTFRVS